MAQVQGGFSPFLQKAFYTTPNAFWRPRTPYHRRSLEPLHTVSAVDGKIHIHSCQSCSKSNRLHYIAESIICITFVRFLLLLLKFSKNRKIGFVNPVRIHREGTAVSLHCTPHLWDCTL